MAAVSTKSLSRNTKVSSRCWSCLSLWKEEGCGEFAGHAQSHESATPWSALREPCSCPPSAPVVALRNTAVSSGCSCADSGKGEAESAQEHPEETAVFLKATTGAEGGQEQGSQREDQHLAETAAFLDRDSALTAAMCDREQEACLLCRRAEADPDTCGEKREKYGLYAHVFCLYFATLLFQQAKKRVGLLGFLPQDIQLAVRRAAQKHCCVCGQSGATIMCCKEGCSRWFHLPCAKEGCCVTQYIAPYRSYCPEHRPEQDVQVTPEPGTKCPICMEPVEDRKTFNTMVCPACKRAWFHRDCLQGQAMCAGLLYFCCPLCRDRETFLVETFFLGIRTPTRLVSFSVTHKTGGVSAILCQALPQ
ncbi:PHD finger protein 7-like [Poecile atricapillus]|uniref:PHD finger protein 7-like n=1 Tax=Poecile atricapillus TaxID=48891 RepID=UPI00273945AE|nr:PHD finger protein 7-like [Poecile atricapillus]